MNVRFTEYTAPAKYSSRGIVPYPFIDRLIPFQEALDNIHEMAAVTWDRDMADIHLKGVVFIFIHRDSGVYELTTQSIEGNNRQTVATFTCNPTPHWRHEVAIWNRP